MYDERDFFGIDHVSSKIPLNRLPLAPRSLRPDHCTLMNHLTAIHVELTRVVIGRQMFRRE
jgi:hypothetical protein